LGARVALVTRLGSDQRGDVLHTLLAEEGVDVRHILRDPEEATGVEVVIVDDVGQREVVTAPGANQQLSVQDVLAAAEVIANARVVLVQLELSLTTVEAAVRIARAAGAKVVLDPSPPRELTEEFLQELHVIRPTPDEAQVLTNVSVNDVDSARRAARNLLRRGVAAAVVGAEGGNLLVTPEGESWFPEISVESVDASAAGDAMAGALSVALAKGLLLPDAVRFATAASALATTRAGGVSALPHLHEVERLLRGVEPAPVLL
jgi:ribokinase